MAKKFDFLSPGIEIREVDQSFIPQQAEATGPIIIGRTRRGPANKPVKVRNLDDFVSIFGLPVAGGNGAQGDVWREGNTVGPTYASYAAQAWLASEQSPVTMVRVSGEQHIQKSVGGEAGWQVGANPIAADGNNSTAYGLFVCDEADAGQGSSLEITLDGGVTTNTDLDNVIITVKRAGSAVGTITFDSSAPFSATVASITEITVGTDGLTTTAQFLNALATGIEKASSEGLLSNASVVAEATKITLINLDTGVSNTLQLLSDTASKFNGGSDLSNDIASNVVAIATTAASNGSLAAVFYCVTGALALSGTIANEGGAAIVAAGALIESVGANREFSLCVHDAGGEITETIQFTLGRNASNSLRSQFNTNPQLTNSTIVTSEDLKTYWLGESFMDHLDSNVSTSGIAGAHFATLLPLGTGGTATTNWGYHRYGAREAKTGWIFSSKATNEQKLFRFKSLHVGEDIQKNYLIAVENLAAPANPNVSKFGSFTIAIKDVAGNTVEKYSNCNLNPASPNYVAARIGDQYQNWSDTDKRYRTYGDFQNQSNLVYIEMNDNVANGGGEGLLPAGFYGPVRPKGFSLIAGDAEAKSLDGSSDFAGAVVQSGISTSLYKGQSTEAGAFADLGTATHVKFVFPKLKMRNLGSDGGATDQSRVYWGVRPKVSAQSTQHDPDYIDYIRGLGMDLGEEATHTPGADFEYSFVFRMDDVSGSVTTGTWSWTEGNYEADLSYSKTNGFNDLLDKNIRQFIMPMWGGSEGFDISEMEPLRNTLIGDSLSETSNYVDYSISKALDSIADSEVVPANLLILPGINKSSVTNKMINIAESRKDILTIIDLEDDYTPRAESSATSISRLGSVTGAITKLKARSLDSSYACTFYPSVQISDNLNGGQLVWVPSSVAAIGALGRSQAQSELWFAPAGFNRGGLGSLGGPRGPKVIQARQRLDSKERDLLYENNINPIATFPSEGVVIFGQKTLQALPSALNRINVRRLVLFLKEEVSFISRNLLFDQNVDTTWNRFKGKVEPLLSDVSSRFGLTDYKVVLDETTTTADLIDRNIMYAKIFIKPARAIEYIVVDFVITRTGADFV